jgi:hypothetical protein
MTRVKSISELGNLYESNIFNRDNTVLEEAKKNNNKFPKDSFPKPGETMKKSKDFESTGPNKAMGNKTSKKVAKKVKKKARKNISEDINSFMKSKFDKLFENVMEDDDAMNLSAGPGVGPEGSDFGSDEGEDDFSDIGGEDEGGEEITLTLDRETAQKLCDMLQAQLDSGESEDESDLEDLEIEDEDMGEDDFGGEEDEGNFGEGIESEKLPDSAGHKLTKAGTVGNVHASKGKASSEVTDETGSETKGHPLDHKSPLTKAGTVGNLKAGSSLFGSK